MFVEAYCAARFTLLAVMPLTISGRLVETSLYVQILVHITVIVYIYIFTCRVHIGPLVDDAW